jgi:hypothetical protein
VRLRYYLVKVKREIQILVQLYISSIIEGIRFKLLTVFAIIIWLFSFHGKKNPQTLYYNVALSVGSAFAIDEGIYERLTHVSGQWLKVSVLRTKVIDIHAMSFINNKLVGRITSVSYMLFNCIIKFCNFWKILG